MFLTNQDIVELAAWRRKLHAMPEVSGEERRTAAEVRLFLEPTGPDRILYELGGHGVALAFEGAEPGPTLMFRAELDALPIAEITDVAHRSSIPGKSHMCGHDGHMATLAALGRGLTRQRPKRGRAVLMFQPAEENGAGAAAVIADERYRTIAPDYAFALHNMPGIPFGAVWLSEGPVTCASRGMRIELTGKTAHASQPETGVSPMQAVSKLMPALTALGSGKLPDLGFAMVTVTHAAMGEASFGIAPGQAEIWATLRTLTDGTMAALAGKAEALVMKSARTAGLEHAISYHDDFAHSENHPEAVAILERALDAEKVRRDKGDLPFRASEDFGRFGKSAKGAMFFLGAGETHPALHNPDYDYPDDLIPIGARVFMRVLRDMLG